MNTSENRNAYFISFLLALNITKILGISYKHHESLCQAKIDAKIQIEETRARDNDIKKLCPYVDCNSQQAKYICAEECIGSKTSLA